MDEQQKIRPFSTIQLDKFFEYDLEKIKMAYRLSGTIHSDLKNIRATGDQVELAVKEFYSTKLFPKYHVCDGHIVDKNLKASPQFDIIISENSKNPVLFDLADKSELVYYESVYLIGEVKKSVYKNDLISAFCANLERLKSEMQRDAIEPSAIESGNTLIKIDEALTDLPIRNPLFSFMFFVTSSNLELSKLSKLFNDSKNANLPNMIVFLDQGILLNVNKSEFDQGHIKINLYPEYASDETWVFMSMHDENATLTYQYMLIVEHLNNVVLGHPKILNYTNNLFSLSPSDFHEL